MDFYEHLKKFNKTITEILKEDTNVLFTELIEPIPLEQLCNPDTLPEQIWEESFSTEKYKDMHSAYFELTKYIYSDYYYQDYLSAALNDNPHIPVSRRHSGVIDIEDYKDDFYDALELLISNWYKFNRSSIESDNLSFAWEIFKVLYSQYSLLCKDAFPVVLFVLADSYYDFCKICYKYERHQNLPKQISQKQSEQILSLFYNRISGDNWQCYLFSLIDTKPTYYSESSFSQGQKKYNILMQATENERRKYDSDLCDIISVFNCMDEIVQKEYQKRLTNKKANRAQKITNGSSIMPGENFQAFWTFLYKFSSDNKWSQYNQAFTLYTLNNMSGWLNVLILSDDKKMNRILFSYYLETTLPASLFFTTASLLTRLDMEQNTGMGENLTYPHILLKNMRKLTDCINDTGSFLKWYLSATKNELCQLQYESEKIYKGMYENLKHGSRIMLDTLSSFLTCYLTFLTSNENENNDSHSM